MFSFFFKKKKKTSSPSLVQSQTTSNIKDQPQSSSTKSTFPQSKSLITKKTTDPVQQKIEQDNDLWLYEYILQYLTSPLWKIPISQFIDENSLIFDNEETNQFTYTEIHNNFKNMIEKMLEELLLEINITEEKFMAQVERGLKAESHKRIFDQLLVVDNFIVFKKLMVKRNKELEFEVMRALEQQEMEKLQSSSNTYNQNEMERTKLEADKAQIEHAIAMSIAVEEEKKKIKLQEELEFEQALKESEQEYQRQQDKLKLGQNPEKTQVPIQPTEKPVQKLEKIQENIQTPIEKLEKTPEKTVENQTFLLTDSHCQKIGSTLDEKKSESSVENKNPKVEEEQKEFVNLKNASKKTVEDDVPLFQSKQNVSKQQSVVKKESHLVELPPLKADLKYDPLSLNELLKEKQSLAAKLDALKAKPNSSIIDELKAGEVSKISTKDEGEGFLERKKRLEKQRELILKKKKEEREKELKEYKETGVIKNDGENNGEKGKNQKPLLVQETSDFSQNKDQLAKRSEIMKKFKENKD